MTEALAFPGLHFHKVYWIHSCSDDPSIFFYEVRDDWVLRVVEVYEDGRLTWADSPDETGGARFPDQPVPPLDELDELQHAVIDIPKQQFEAAWTAARNKG
ncbi:hypothetical protein GTA62_12430 [Roseobacter sp. HKCCD9010]|uniref:DUF6881 domain-containing protein n=1 Tax=unclassified Roseobacter TaxID=196798 RepID=UPI001490FAE3|nr:MULTISPECIES: hypothetical protein [unclassified Roseobacter]MBF9050009.1 hypothetical protein [Rhodobacterales bacterium HKCCD4356]NNV12252.1 hypothetical protein [Roseobacter sp. HKCCD7357]NNV16285.1 hypothetical protein [Roseobacter sp. HKCCD8768]NNV25745.1 hypothetical protein [Roseobacter sp. HKCCD8192]NNV30001.1 hypothetical protein [Roseobacter sp. HKCCD9061]